MRGPIVTALDCYVGVGAVAWMAGSSLVTSWWELPTDPWTLEGLGWSGVHLAGIVVWMVVFTAQRVDFDSGRDRGISEGKTEE